MTQIRPPGPWSHDIHEWHNTYRPDFFMNISMGYLEGSTTTLMRSRLTGIAKNKEILFDNSRYEVAAAPVLPGVQTASPGPLFLVSDNPLDAGVFLCSALAADGTRVRAFTVLNGTTPVAIDSGNDLLHVRNLLQVSGTLHSGTIFVSDNAGGVPTPAADVIAARVEPGRGFGASPLTICPNDHTLIFSERLFSGSSSFNGVVRLYVRFAGTSVFSMTYEMDVAPGTTVSPINPPIVLSEGDALFISVSTAKGGNDAGYHMAHVLLNGTVGSQRGADLIFEDAP